MTGSHPVKYHVQFLFGEDLGVGLGLFKILGEDLCDLLGLHTEIGSDLLQTILH